MSGPGDDEAEAEELPEDKVQGKERSAPRARFVSKTSLALFTITTAYCALLAVYFTFRDMIARESVPAST